MSKRMTSWKKVESEETVWIFNAIAIILITTMVISWMSVCVAWTFLFLRLCFEMIDEWNIRYLLSSKGNHVLLIKCANKIYFILIHFRLKFWLFAKAITNWLEITVVIVFCYASIKIW